MKLSKKQNRMNWKNCRISLAKQLWTLRTENRLTIDYVSQKTLLPSFFIENMETGRCDLKIGNLMVLTRFYGKKVKIELQD